MLSQDATVFTIPAINDFTKCCLAKSFCNYLVRSVFHASSLSCRSFVGYNYKFGSSFVRDYSRVDFSLVRLIKEIRNRYSKTSNNGPSEKRTTSLQRTAHLPPIDFTIELIHFEPPRSGHLSTPNNGH